ncbi:hypothetical protein TNCV_4067701 [Trichonephila clavipes]|nr:hypothetical protein TNCV_4067701 [Trichonephila clavipes]
MPTATSPATHCRARLQWCWTRTGHVPGQRADPAFPIARRTGPQPRVMVFLTAAPLWSSLEAYLQHSGTLTTF